MWSGDWTPVSRIVAGKCFSWMTIRRTIPPSWCVALGQRDNRVRCLRRIWSPGPLDRVHRRDARQQRALPRGHRRRSAARRDAFASACWKLLSEDAVDVVVGSRYLDGGGLGEWSRSRALISRLSARLSRTVVRAELTDPMSGFFMIRRSAFEEVVRNLSGMGFKILLDILASSPRPLRLKELPYQFRASSGRRQQIGQPGSLGVRDAVARQADRSHRADSICRFHPGRRARSSGAPRCTGQPARRVQDRAS